MTSVVVVATAYPKPECAEAVKQAFVDAVPRVHAEDGCDLYALHEGDTRLVLIEKWASQAALDVHARAQALADLRAKMDGKIIGDFDIQLMTPHPAGTSQQGVL